MLLPDAGFPVSASDEFLGHADVRPRTDDFLLGSAKCSCLGGIGTDLVIRLDAYGVWTDTSIGCQRLQFHMGAHWPDVACPRLRLSQPCGGRVAERRLPALHPFASQAHLMCAILNLLLKHLDVTHITYKKGQMKHLQKHLKTIANIRNIQIKHFQHTCKNICNIQINTLATFV
jgi:hypothetical protein